jgi:hypothetical protein
MIDQVVHRPAAASRLARIAGAFYLPVFLLGPFSLLYVRDTVLVPGDAAATADQIAAHGGLLRAGSVVELYLALTDVVLAAAFYVLFRSVSQPLALVMALLRFTWAVVAAVTMLTNIAALLVLGDADYLTAFDTDQRQAAALFLLDLHEPMAAAGFVAFGAHLAVLGCLGWTSRLLPRVIGVLLLVAGAGYVLNSLLVLGWARPAQLLFLLPAFPAELSLCLWLLIKGVPAKEAGTREVGVTRPVRKG